MTPTRFSPPPMNHDKATELRAELESILSSIASRYATIPGWPNRPGADERYEQWCWDREVVEHEIDMACAERLARRGVAITGPERCCAGVEEHEWDCEEHPDYDKRRWVAEDDLNAGMVCRHGMLSGCQRCVDGDERDVAGSGESRVWNCGHRVTVAPGERVTYSPQMDCPACVLGRDDDWDQHLAGARGNRKEDRMTDDRQRTIVSWNRYHHPVYSGSYAVTLSCGHVIHSIDHGDEGEPLPEPVVGATKVCKQCHQMAGQR